MTVPSGFIVRPGAGLAPGVRVTLVPITAATPFVVSLEMIEAVVPPDAPLIGVAVKSSSTASMVGFTGVGPAVLVQRASAGQVGSPPPLTVAVLVTLGKAAAVGVTGITKLVLPPAARPAATVQVTV